MTFRPFEHSVSAFGRPWGCPNVLRGVLFTALLPLAALRIGAGEPIPPQIVQNVRHATVMVSVEYDDPPFIKTHWGSGIVAGPGLVVTNAHVVNENPAASIYVSNDILPRTPARVVVLRYDSGEQRDDSGDDARKNVDMAILSFQQPDGTPVPALPFALRAVPSEPIIVAGYPGDAAGSHAAGEEDASGSVHEFSAPLVVTAGAVTGVADGEPGLVIHDARCSPGNSGGPVVNFRGEAVGMQTWTSLPGDPGRYMSIAIGGGDIVAFLEANGFHLLRP